MPSKLASGRYAKVRSRYGGILISDLRQQDDIAGIGLPAGSPLPSPTPPEGRSISHCLEISVDVDAAIVTLSGLSLQAISRVLAAIALAATIVANMALKIAIVGVYARKRGAGAIVGVGASTGVLLLVIGWGVLS